MSRRAAWAMPRGPMPGHAAAILGRLQAADKDKDGKLSKSEAPERLQQHFAKIDANKDGQLDKAELGKALAAMGKQVRESMEKRRAEMVMKSHEARGDGAHKDAAERKHAGQKPGEKQHGDVKKPIDKKVKQKKPEKKLEQKKAEEKKADEKKADEKKS